MSIVPSDRDRSIPACFGDNATVSGIVSPINAGTLLEFLIIRRLSLLLLIPESLIGNNRRGAGCHCEGGEVMDQGSLIHLKIFRFRC